MADANLTDDNSNLVDMDNLDNFSETFFSGKPVATDDPDDKPQEDEKDIPENEDDALATEEDTDAPEDTSEDEDQSDEDDASDEPEEDDEEEEKPQKKGKKSFQERINELTAKAREAERRAERLEADYQRRLAELEKKATRDEDAKSDPKPLREQLSSGAPDPDAVDENGEPVYPLGEFDKAYIRDLTKFTIAEENAVAKAERDKAEKQRMVEAAQEELKSSWLSKVEEAEAELPDIRERLAEMDGAFADVDPDYGEFLAATIMACDNGPQMMYYLSQNIGEAQKIVASGPAAATLALGRLDARFAKSQKQENRNTKKQSDAPTPPAARTRGSGSRTSVAPDTGDLNAFEREFYKRKK